MSIFSNIFDSIGGVNFIIGPGSNYTDGNTFINRESNTYSAKVDSIASVYTCNRILADSVSRLPLNIIGEDGKGNRIVLKDDFRYPMLHYNPNPYTTTNQFFNMAEHVKNIKGNSYARIQRKNGRPIGLYLIPSSLVTGKEIIGQQLYYNMQDEDGNKKPRINSDNMLHFRFSGGLNPIEKLRLNISTSIKGAKTIDTHYGNAATPAKVLMRPIFTANKKAYDESIAKFESQYSGPNNSGKLAKLPDSVKLLDMQMNFKDSQYIQTIEYNTAQIGALYGIPPHLLGLKDSAQLKDAESNQLNFKMNTMAAILRMYKAELEFKLLTQEERLDGMSIEFNSKSLIEADLATRIQAYKDEIQYGIIDPNTVARLEGLPTYDNGEFHYSPTNLTITELRVQDGKDVIGSNNAPQSTPSSDAD